jgi:hypothetical protein
LTSSQGSLSTLSTQFSVSIIEASSVGRIAYSRLREGGEGTVHGVFDAAINILFAGGLVSLVPEAVQRGPLNVTLRLPVGSPRMGSFGVRAGDKVRVRGSTLELGDRHLISFGSAEIYSPKHKFTLPMLTDDEIEANLEVVRKTALHFGNMAGLGELLALTPLGAGRATAGSLNMFASFALRRIGRLEQAFRSEEKDALTVAVSELIGLGTGLTPSSDDMLAGLVLVCVLYAKNRGYARRASRLIAQVIAEEARGRTTMLSEEYLVQAASGRGNEPVMRLCTSMLTGGRESVERETRRVLAIGETSGTDTVLGIVLGTMLCTGKQSSLAMRESE